MFKYTHSLIWGRRLNPNPPVGARKTHVGFPLSLLFFLFSLEMFIEPGEGRKDWFCGKALLAEAQHASAFELFMQNRIPSA